MPSECAGLVVALVVGGVDGGKVGARGRTQALRGALARPGVLGGASKVIEVGVSGHGASLGGRRPPTRGPGRRPRTRGHGAAWWLGGVVAGSKQLGRWTRVLVSSSPGR